MTRRQLLATIASVPFLGWLKPREAKAASVHFDKWEPEYQCHATMKVAQHCTIKVTCKDGYEYWIGMFAGETFTAPRDAIAFEVHPA